MDKVLTKRNTLFIVAALTLWRAYLSATIQLHPDEAYYWLYSRRLDFGYYDHAPLVGYLIRLTTLFSSQELWVRFGGLLETVVVSIISWVLSMQLFNDRKVASASVITLNVLPLTMAGSIVMTPDNPLFLFVGLTTYFWWQIVETQKPRYWYLLGIAFGLSLLSKYTGVLVAPSVFIFILATDERKWLKTIHPYAAFLLGCAFFLPVVYWNSRHEWMSFVFQLKHGLGGETYKIGRVLTYIGGQMLVAGPVLWVAGTVAAVTYLFRKDKRTLFLSLSFLPTILFFAYSSLKRTAAANWPCTAYVVFGILVSYYLLDGSKRKERIWIAGILLSLTLSRRSRIAYAVRSPSPGKDLPGARRSGRDAVLFRLARTCPEAGGRSLDKSGNHQQPSRCRGDHLLHPGADLRRRQLALSRSEPVRPLGNTPERHRRRRRLHRRAGEIRASALQ